MSNNNCTVCELEAELVKAQAALALLQGRNPFEPIRDELKRVSNGQPETWGYAYLFSEMVDTAEKDWESAITATPKCVPRLQKQLEQLQKQLKELRVFADRMRAFIYSHNAVGGTWLLQDYLKWKKENPE